MPRKGFQSADGWIILSEVKRNLGDEMRTPHPAPKWAEYIHKKFSFVMQEFWNNISKDPALYCKKIIYISLNKYDLCLFQQTLNTKPKYQALLIFYNDIYVNSRIEIKVNDRIISTKPSNLTCSNWILRKYIDRCLQA